MGTFEIAEFFHDHQASNNLYFAFIDEFIEYYHSQCDDVESCPSQQSIYEWTIASNSFATKHGIGRTAMESLEFALSLHHYTPRTAMFEQLYESQRIHSMNSGRREL